MIQSQASAVFHRIRLRSVEVMANALAISDHPRSHGAPTLNHGKRTKTRGPVLWGLIGSVGSSPKLNEGFS